MINKILKIDKQEKLEKNLLSYPANSEIVIEFNNMNFKAQKPDIVNFFQQDYPKKNITNLITRIDIDFHETQEDGFRRKKGTGRITTNNKEFAAFCLKKDGSVSVLNFNLYIY